MAGANGILKKAIWNREDQFQALQFIGPFYNQVQLNLTGNNPPVINTNFPLAAITPAQFLADWVITAATPLALTAPLNTALNAQFQQNTAYIAGNQVTMSIINTTGVARTDRKSVV